LVFDHPGTLVVSPPVVIQTHDRDPDHGGGAIYPYGGSFGSFTGALPYPESLFAPYAAAAADSGSASAANPSDPSTTAPETARARDFGIDEEPVVDPGSVRGIKVSRVYPGTAAEQAGLKAGDVIHSINGYLTQQRGNLAWIIAHAAAEKVLTIKLRSPTDGKDHTITARLP
jgi:hypothetical protein